MKVYWEYKSRESMKAEIIEDIERAGAQPWESTGAKSHVFVGIDEIFIYPPDYHIDGYSLNTRDLEGLLARLNDRKNLLICDGCNVRPPFEHRCHQNRAFVNGESTGKSCQCPDCFESFPF